MEQYNEDEDRMVFRKNALRVELVKTEAKGARLKVTFAGMSEYIGIPKGSLHEYAEGFDLVSKALKVWHKSS